MGINYAFQSKCLMNAQKGVTNLINNSTAVSENMYVLARIVSSRHGIWLLNTTIIAYLVDSTYDH